MVTSINKLKNNNVITYLMYIRRKWLLNQVPHDIFHITIKFLTYKYLH